MSSAAGCPPCARARPPYKPSSTASTPNCTTPPPTSSSPTRSTASSAVSPTASTSSTSPASSESCDSSSAKSSSAETTTPSRSATRSRPPQAPTTQVTFCVGAVISPVLCNVYLHRLDRQWARRGAGVPLRYADDLLVMCKTKQEAEDALVALSTVLGDLGLALKHAKTGIVHLREGGKGFDFVGFHHRYVRGNTPRSWHVTFLVC